MHFFTVPFSAKVNKWNGHKRMTIHSVHRVITSRELLTEVLRPLSGLLLTEISGIPELQQQNRRIG